MYFCNGNFQKQSESVYSQTDLVLVKRTFTFNERLIHLSMCLLSWFQMVSSGLLGC